MRCMGNIPPLLPISRIGERQWEQVGAMRRMGCHQPTAALDAESAEVLGNIRGLL